MSEKRANYLQQWDVRGKVCLVTGASSGIGREIAMRLAREGAGRVIMTCRDVEKGEAAANYVRHQAGISKGDTARVALRTLDLCSLESVRRFAKQINDEEPQLHVLINNAGMLAPGRREETKDGFELNFGANYLGHFLLTKLLLDLLKKSGPSRIVLTSSWAYKLCWPTGFHINDPNYENSSFETMFAYSQSKLAIILFTRALDRRLNGKAPSGVTVFTANPGAADTDVIRYLPWYIKYPGKIVQFLLFFTPKQASQTPFYCATQPNIEQFSGCYFSDSKPSDTWIIAKDDYVGEQLWKLSEELIASARLWSSHLESE